MEPSVSVDSTSANVQAAGNQQVVETQANAGTASAASGTQDASVVSVYSVDQLQQKAPEVWNAMMMGMAQQICQKSKNSVDRQIAIRKEAESRIGR